MSVHDSEGDKITAALTLKSCFFGGGEISRPIYLSSNNKDVVLILAIADGCNHQMTSHYKRFKGTEQQPHQKKCYHPSNCLSFSVIAGENDDLDPPDNFREYSVIPTQQDILTGERPFLRRNKTDGSYNDAEHYLDVQFRLLREDFVRPLREGIAKLLERIGSAKIGALQDIRVYKDVRLLYPICTTDGLRYRIKFDNTRLRNVRWENSKRLIFGSLMCLSKDKFESFVFATIANRDAKELKQVLKLSFFFPQSFDPRILPNINVK